MNVFHCLFSRLSPKEEQHWYSWCSQYEVWQFFGVCVCLCVCVCVHVCVVIPEQRQTSTAVTPSKRGSLFPLHGLCQIKSHSLRSYNFLLKHNSLASSFAFVLQGEMRKRLLVVSERRVGINEVLLVSVFWKGRLHLFFELPLVHSWVISSDSVACLKVYP